jgi:hypothetical protein
MGLWTDVLIATSKKVALGWVYDRWFDCHKSNGGTGVGLSSKTVALGWVYGQVF